MQCKSIFKSTIEKNSFSCLTAENDEINIFKVDINLILANASIDKLSKCIKLFFTFFNLFPIVLRKGFYKI